MHGHRGCIFVGVGVDVRMWVYGATIQTYCVSLHTHRSYIKQV